MKHKDWENEDEHRLFIMDYYGKLSVDGCIKYIVLGRKVLLDSVKMKSLMDMLVDPIPYYIVVGTDRSMIVWFSLLILLLRFFRRVL